MYTAGKIEILNKPFVRRPIKTTIKKKRDKTKANKKVPNFNIALNCDMIKCLKTFVMHRVQSCFPGLETRYMHAFLFRIGKFGIFF